MLDVFTKMAQTPLEIIESVDMNRLLENGVKSKITKTDFPSYSVDTLEDLDKVELLMENDALLHHYV